jgi:hypothetical protein
MIDPARKIEGGARVRRRLASVLAARRQRVKRILTEKSNEFSLLL